MSTKDLPRSHKSLGTIRCMCRPPLWCTSHWSPVALWMMKLRPVPSRPNLTWSAFILKLPLYNDSSVTAGRKSYMSYTTLVLTNRATNQWLLVEAAKRNPFLIYANRCSRSIQRESTAGLFRHPSLWQGNVIFWAVLKLWYCLSSGGIGP